MPVLDTLTVLIYVALFFLWATILLFYLSTLSREAALSASLRLLLLVLAIDAFRTVFESGWFGLSLASALGWSSAGFAEFFNTPVMRMIPKSLNLFAGILILSLLSRGLMHSLAGERQEELERVARLQTDMEERDRIEEQLEREKAIAEQYLSLVGVMVIALDRKGRVTLANRKVCEVTGYDEIELLGTDWFKLVVPPEELDLVRNVFSTLLDGSGKLPESFTNAILTKTGKRRTVSWHNTALVDDQGRVIGSLSSGEDITQKLEAQHKLEELGRWQDMIVHSAGEGIFGVDTEGKTLFVNPAAERMIGLSANDLIGQDHHQLIHYRREDGTPYPHTECPVFQTLRDGQTRESDDEVFWTADGTPIAVELICAPIKDGDAIFGAVMVFHDVTDRRRAQSRQSHMLERLSTSNRDLEEFAYIVSHDMQEPLRMISSYLELLRRRYAGKLDPDADEFIHFAVDGAERMHKMIQDILQYSRITTKGAALEPTDSGGALREALANLTVRIEETGAEVAVPETLPEVIADRGQLVRLFQNLIGNALKYHAPDRPPRIAVTVTEGREGPGGKRWRFSVADNGIGMDPDGMQRIFVPFQRLHSHNEYEGTGIGLALCRKIVERHAGEIWADSEPGIGSTFHFVLCDATCQWREPLRRKSDQPPERDADTAA